MSGLAHLKFHLRDLPELYNYVEVGLWPGMALILLVWGVRRRGAARRDAIIAAFTLLFFGASDWFEANTGNEWWHPWWLFLWKASCVVILLGVLAIAWKRSRRNVNSQVG